MYFTPGTTQFKLFGGEHITVMLLLLLIYIGLYLGRSVLRRDTVDRRMRLGIILLILIEEISFNAYRIGNGIWMLETSLPLHYCNMMMYASIYLMWTGKRSVFELVYLFGLAGTIQAIVTPALQEGFPHFRFIQFYMAHGLIIFSGLYYVFVHGYRPDLNSVKRTFILINVSIPPIMLINWLTGGNYNNLNRVPDVPTLIDFLGPWPYYLIPLEVLAILFLLLAYAPFAVIRSLEAGKGED